MQFLREEKEDRPLFSELDEEVLQRVRSIVEKLPQTVRVGTDKVPLTSMLVTFAVAKALKLKLHLGYDIVHPKNSAAWYWLVTRDDAYIDLDPRLIRGVGGIVMIHPSHPFRGFHVYRALHTISSYNMFFDARGEQGKRESETIEEIIGHIHKIEGTFPSHTQQGSEPELSEIAVPA